MKRKYPEYCPGCGKKLYTHFTKTIVRGDANNWWPHDWEKCKQLSEIKTRDIWVPVEKIKDIICKYMKCMGGMGLVGNGHCYLTGDPYIKNCPKFEDHDKIMSDHEAGMSLTEIKELHNA